jgi:uncharacterized protein YkwD
VTWVPAAAPIRLALAFALAASLVAFVVAGRAEGAGSSWRSYLAPAGVCPGAADRNAPPAVQERAAACLVNWARARAHVSRLRRPASLGRAATLKGRKVAACRQFSHSPCGIHPGASTRAAGYRYSRLGENLYLGTWGGVSPRDAVAAWLRSPAHRANLLRPGFRHLGAALVRASSLQSGGDSAVWVTQLATPR